MQVHFLGTGSAGADGSRTTTMLAFEHAGAFFLVDCGGDAVQRLQAAGLDATAVSAVVLTHAHPDHIAGFPLLVEKLWLLGRRETIPVYGPASTLRVARALMDCFDTGGWKDVPEREWHEVPLEPLTPVFEREGFRVEASPVDHPVDTIGLRVEAGGRVAAYSADTSKTEAVVGLARGAGLLVHEATESQPGVHASPEEAAETARDAGAQRLVLVHLPSLPCPDKLARARETFPETVYGSDGMALSVKSWKVES